MSILLHMLNDPKVLAVILGICGTGINSLAIQKHWSYFIKEGVTGVVALILGVLTGVAEGKFSGNLSDIGTLFTYAALSFTTARGLYLSIEASFPKTQPLTAIQEATTLKKTATP